MVMKVLGCDERWCEGCENCMPCNAGPISETQLDRCGARITQPRSSLMRRSVKLLFGTRKKFKSAVAWNQSVGCAERRNRPRHRISRIAQKREEQRLMKCRQRAGGQLAGNVRVTVCGIARDRFTREMSPAASDLDSDLSWGDTAAAKVSDEGTSALDGGGIFLV